MDLVRRQLARDYHDEDLRAEGLRIFTTLDPAAQRVAERALASRIAEFEASGRSAAAIDGAVIVTEPASGRVQALVGGRDARGRGFNRALDAKRQVGSLIKPAVYLAALESNRHSLASLIDDEAIEVPLDDGTVWSPTNFNDEAHGAVTAVRALSESFNMATVRLGMDTGLAAVAELLTRLGLEQSPALYPSLLLGAIELTPIEPETEDQQ